MSALSLRRNRRLSEHQSSAAPPSHVQVRAPQPSQPPVSWAPPARLEKKWMVYVQGGEVVGPVSADQVARGIKAGVIPIEASVQAAGEVFWDGVFDNPAIMAALKSL